MSGDQLVAAGGLWPRPRSSSRRRGPPRVRPGRPRRRRSGPGRPPACAAASRNGSGSGLPRVMSSAAISVLGRIPACVETGLGQPAGRGGDDGPALGGQRAQQGGVPGSSRRLPRRRPRPPAARSAPRPRGPRRRAADRRRSRRPGRPCSSTRANSSPVIPYSCGPPGPAAGHGLQGGDEGSVVVEQERVGVDLHGAERTATTLRGCPPGAEQHRAFWPVIRVAAMLDALTAR